MNAALLIVILQNVVAPLENLNILTKKNVGLVSLLTLNCQISFYIVLAIVTFISKKLILAAGSELVQFLSSLNS
jgi:hypothetical protein